MTFDQVHSQRLFILPFNHEFCKDLYLMKSLIDLIDIWIDVRNWSKKGKRKVQGVSQWQAEALPTKRKRKQTKPNKRKSNKRTKVTKISSLFPKWVNRNAKKTEKHKNKIA